MKIIDYVVKTFLVIVGLLILGYLLPVVSWFEKIPIKGRYGF